jgi:hypothetical protein
MRLLRRCRLAIGGLFSCCRRDFRQHRSLQFRTGPDLGHARRRGQLRCLRSLRSAWSRGRTRGLRHLRHAGNFHRRHRWLLGLSHGRQGEALSFHLVTLDHRFAEILNLHRRRLSRSRRHAWHPGWCRARRRRWRRHYDRLFFHMVEHDRFLRSRIGDDAAIRRINAHLAVAGSIHARRRLRRRTTSSRLHLGGALGTGRRNRRRRWRNLPHCGLSLPRNPPGAEQKVYGGISCAECGEM